MTDHWELIDVVKTLLSLAAGMLLGLERELKDKAAGLKTISIICLGATLFSIISFKIGGVEDTRIASYIVSGVGFIGAGVIFKDGLNVSGLTTAGIIWLAAAIGTSIGFGEFYLAATFLVASLLLIYSSPYINKLLKSKKQTRQLEFELDKKDLGQKNMILTALKQQGILTEEKIMVSKDDNIRFTIEVVLRYNKIKWLQEYLLQHEKIKAFSF
jgi:putative Mg2+ transporter-C (MgtC) family protein